jgi:hypothetical protein
MYYKTEGTTTPNEQKEILKTEILETETTDLNQQ